MRLSVKRSFTKEENDHSLLSKTPRPQLGCASQNCCQCWMSPKSVSCSSSSEDQRSPRPRRGARYNSTHPYRYQVQSSRQNGQEARLASALQHWHLVQNRPAKATLSPL